MAAPQSSLKRKRHYKKDTSYLYDLYTLTFDENETLESLDETVSHKISKFDNSIDAKNNRDFYM